MTTRKDNCNHERLQPDYFYLDMRGVSRSVDGDCVCRDCLVPLPVWWNKGKPYPAAPQPEQQP
jgi:hypothetical protein